MKPCEFIATQGMDDPRLIAVCETCKHPRCDKGICETYMQEYYKLYPKSGPRRRAMQYSIWGVKATIKEWSEFSGVTEMAVRGRMRRGMTLGEAIGSPNYNTVRAWEREREAEKDG